MTTEPIDIDQMTDDEYLAALALLIEAAKDDFITFFHLLHPEGQSELVLGDLHRFLAMLVQGVADGTRPKHNCVSVPPQHGKSTMLSVLATAWLVGRFPGKRVAITGFSFQLVRKFAKQIKAIIESPIYQAIFPGVLPVPGEDRADEFVLTNGSSVLAKSKGSKLTGNKVDWLLVDDAHPGRAEAESPTQRRNVIEWFFADCMSRTNPGTKIFLIGTRWHPGDLIGHLTSPEYTAQLRAEEADDAIFHVVNLPAIADHNPEAGEVDPLGREPGEALFPQERPVSFLRSIRASIPNYEWESQYMGRPRTASSGEVDVSKIVYIEPKDIPWDELIISRGWDLALTEKQTSDFSVGALCGWHVEKETFYVLDVFRRRISWAKLKAHLISKSYDDLEQHKVARIGIEGVGGFDAICQDIHKELLGDIKVEKKNPPKGGKLLRAQPWLNKLEAGQMVVVRAAWTKDYVDELEIFPEGKHDDQIDGTSIGWEMVVKPKRRLLIA